MQFKLKRAVAAVAVMAFTMQASASMVDRGPMAEPQCAQVICLSPADGTPAPPECTDIRAEYFNIRIYNPYYDGSSTSEARHAYISMCTTARAMDLQKITNKYGTLFTDPMTY